MVVIEVARVEGPPRRAGRVRSDRCSLGVDLMSAGALGEHDGVRAAVADLDHCQLARGQARGGPQPLDSEYAAVVVTRTTAVGRSQGVRDASVAEVVVVAANRRVIGGADDERPGVGKSQAHEVRAQVERAVGGRGAHVSLDPCRGRGLRPPGRRPVARIDHGQLGVHRTGDVLLLDEGQKMHAAGVPLRLSPQRVAGRRRAEVVSPRRQVAHRVLVVVQRRGRSA